MNGTYLITFLCHWKNWFSSREIRLSRAIKEEGVGWPLSTCSQINIWKIVLAVMWMLNIKRVEVRWLSFNKRNWWSRVRLTDGTLSCPPPTRLSYPPIEVLAIRPRFWQTYSDFLFNMGPRALVTGWRAPFPGSLARSHCKLFNLLLVPHFQISFQISNRWR